MSLLLRPRVNADRQKWLQKAHTQNVPHMIETSQAKTTRYFLRVRSAKQTGGNGMSLKITRKD